MASGVLIGIRNAVELEFVTIAQMFDDIPTRL